MARIVPTPSAPDRQDPSESPDRARPPAALLSLSSPDTDWCCAHTDDCAGSHPAILRPACNFSPPQHDSGRQAMRIRGRASSTRRIRSRTRTLIVILLFQSCTQSCMDQRRTARGVVLRDRTHHDHNTATADACGHAHTAHSTCTVQPSSPHHATCTATITCSSAAHIHRGEHTSGLTLTASKQARSTEPDADPRLKQAVRRAADCRFRRVFYCAQL